MASAAKRDRTSAAFDRFDVLSRMGSALGRVKAARRLTLPDMEEALGKSEDQIARYIAGGDMPVSVWMKALHLWPELAERFEESTTERAMQGRQRPLDLDVPPRRDRAA
jgi:predicted DNA-binding transcriptional regulator AlpA